MGERFRQLIPCLRTGTDEVMEPYHIPGAEQCQHLVPMPVEQLGVAGEGSLDERQRASLQLFGIQIIHTV